jgi:exodeoxyribonuclease VII large subunit
MMTNPYVFLTEKQQDLERTLDELRGEISVTIDRESAEHLSREGMLRSLSPQSTLDRGYSVVRDKAGMLVSDGSKVKAGTKLNIRLAKGEIEATSN